MRVGLVGGSGGVGSSTAYNLLLHRVADEVVVVDRRPNMVASHVLDLEQTRVLGAGGTIRGGRLDELSELDVVVISAATPQRVNVTRHVFLRDNAAIVAGVLEHLPMGWPGVVVVVTNPVDPLVSLAVRDHGLDRHRVVGYTLNDSLRLRTGIAAELGVAPAAVEAWMVGEHGDASVPLWDRVLVDGKPVTLDAAVREAALAFQRNWYREHVALDSGRTSTWTSGLGVARMVQAIATCSPDPWPASVVLAGEHGIEDVAVSVPVRLGRDGVREVLQWPLTDEQRAGLTGAAEVVGQAVAAAAR